MGSVWEATDQQAGRHGVLIDYAAGDNSSHFETLTTPERAADAAGWIDEVLPGSRRGLTEAASVSWPVEPYTGGAWVAPRPGQMRLYRDALRHPAGRIHLAGEHTDDLYPGYMEGAVRSGQRVAGEIRAAVR
jgi:monoamine oxidase